MTFRDLKIGALIFALGFGSATYTWFSSTGATIGSALQLAGARVIEAAAPSYVSAEIDGGTTSTTLTESFVQVPSSHAHPAAAKRSGRR